MPTNLYELRDQMLALDADDRDNLLAMIERETAAIPFQPAAEDNELWEIISKLCPMAIGKLSAFVGNQRGISKSAWSDGVKQLYQFVAQAQPVRHAQQDASALLELVLEALINDMKQRNVEISPKTILAALPRLRVAVDHCYPGYLDAKMLHMLIRVSA